MRPVTLADMRLGVLDVGSNTVHLLVVDAFRGAHPTPMTSEKTVLRLAERIGPERRLAAADADELVRTVAEAETAAVRTGCEDLMGFATSAIREAENSAEVLQRVHDETGVELQVLSGEQEARLTFPAVRRWFGCSAGRLLLDTSEPGRPREVVLETQMLTGSTAAPGPGCGYGTVSPSSEAKYTPSSSASTRWSNVDDQLGPKNNPCRCDDTCVRPSTRGRTPSSSTSVCDSSIRPLSTSIGSIRNDFFPHGITDLAFAPSCRPSRPAPAAAPFAALASFPPAPTSFPPSLATRPNGMTVNAVSTKIDVKLPSPVAA